MTNCIHRNHTTLQLKFKKNSYTTIMQLSLGITTTITTKNLVVCNPSLCNYMQPNVACDYKWLPMQLLFKFG